MSRSESKKANDIVIRLLNAVPTMMVGLTVASVIGFGFICAKLAELDTR